MKTAGILAEPLVAVLVLFKGGRSSSRRELDFGDLLPVVALGGSVVGYATILAMDDAWAFEDLRGPFLLATESTISPTTLKLAIPIGITLSREVAAG